MALESSATRKWSSLLLRTRPRSVIPQLRTRNGLPLSFQSGTFGMMRVAMVAWSVMRVPRFDSGIPQAGFARPVVDDRRRRYRLFKAPWFPEELGMFQAEWATPWGFIQLGGPRSSRLGRPRSPTEDSWLVFVRSITNADVHVDVF